MLEIGSLGRDKPTLLGSPFDKARALPIRDREGVLPAALPDTHLINSMGITNDTTSPCRRSGRRNHGRAHRRPFCQCRHSRSTCSISFFPISPSAMPPRWPESRAPPKQKPGGFFTDAAKVADHARQFRRRPRPTSASCDWIIEAVAENLEIKRDLWQESPPCARPARSSPPTPAAFRWRRSPKASTPIPPALPRHALLQSAALPAPGRSDPRRRDRPEVLAFVADFCDRHLGKGVVPLQGHAELHRQSHRLLLRRHRPQAHGRGRLHRRRSGRAHRPADRPAEERQLPADRYRRPRRLGARRCAISTTLVPHDPWRDRFVLPEFMEQMMERGWLGEKRGQGFYKRVGKDEREIHAHRLEDARISSGAQSRSFPSVEARAAYRGSAAAPARAGRAPTIAPASSCGSCSAISSSTPPQWCRRSPIASSRSIAPCAGATPTSSGPFELWDALGVPETRAAHASRRLRDSRRTSSACSAPARQRSISTADRDGRARTRATSI